MANQKSSPPARITSSLQIAAVVIVMSVLFSPAAPAQEDVVIGVVGCSQTSNVWKRWQRVLGDPRIWFVESGYGGGSTNHWVESITRTEDKDYFERLDLNQTFNEYPTVIWWQVCENINEPATRQQAHQVYREIRARYPEIPILVSTLADFETPETCDKQDIPNSHYLVNSLVARGLVERGPILPKVQAEWIEEGDGTCHMGPIGATIMAESVATFDWERSQL